MMETTEQESLRGKELQKILYQQYGDIGLSKIFLCCNSDYLFQIGVVERDLGALETYSLEITAVTGDVIDNDIKELIVNRRISNVLILKRDEWEIVSDNSLGCIGISPRTQMCGPIGSAPKNVTNVLTVISGLLINFKDNTRILFKTSDFPLLMDYISIPQHIEEYLGEVSSCE